MLWPYVSRLYCRQCGQPVRKDTPQQIWDASQNDEIRLTNDERSPNGEVLITFDLPLSEKLSLEESLALVSKQGYQRLLVNGQIVRLDEIIAAQSKISRSAAQKSKIPSLTVIQDRVKLAPANRARFVEACEQAYHFGKGKLAIRTVPKAQSGSQLPSLNSQLCTRFSNRLHCARCDIEYREPSPALFSFNHPVGACPKCKGFGRVISIDYNLAIPDHSRTLAQGVVKPWLTGHGLESQQDLMRACRALEIPTDVPFSKLAKKWQKFVIDGDPDYGTDEEHEWPRAWYGVKGYFRWLESKAYKMHVRVLLSRYRAYTTCEDCQGQRFQPEALLYRTSVERGQPCPPEPIEPERADQAARAPAAITLADFYRLPIRDALDFVDGLAKKHQPKASDPLGLVLNEVRSRLAYLDEVGLGYLTLDRPTRSLSGGETERVNLTTCLGTRLVNTLFVLDEPSVGLHPRDTERLVRILQQLRDAGNTVVVVEHEASVMRAANQIVDLGPGHGATGGQVVFQGSFEEVLRSDESLTGQYLSGKQQIEVSRRRPIRAWQEDQGELVQSPNSSVRYWPRNASALILNDAPSPLNANDERGDSRWLKLAHATLHNLKDLTAEIPLGRFVCITGVSGSGKTTLVREVLLPALAAKLGFENAGVKASERFGSEHNGDDTDDDAATGDSSPVTLEGSGHLRRVVLVDQSILGKTPRSNPAVYIGAFDDIREFYAQSESAQQRGLNASAFSFNSGQGQCERCRGAGFEKIEMQFLSDVFIRCPDCGGRRYRQHILEIKLSPKRREGSPKSKVQSPKSEAQSRYQKPEIVNQRRALSIADLLDSTVEEAISFLSSFPESRHAGRAVESLRLLAEVGLGYLKLGQPINTLSGGESQRLKLVRHLAEAHTESNVEPGAVSYSASSRHSSAGSSPALFLFDEPTTGLHFDDVPVLLKVFQRLVDAGHSVLVIEHNLDVIKSADWIIDLGPDAGDQGGQIVATGTPEEVAESDTHTGKALRAVLDAIKNGPAPAHVT
jgi:excinuclease ABC subunit A